MKTKRILIGALSAALCLSSLAACGGAGNETGGSVPASSGTSDVSGKSDHSDTPVSSAPAESSLSETSTDKAEPTPAASGTLYIRDLDKHSDITAVFINSVSGATEEVPMEKIGEDTDYFTYSCQTDSSRYTMVHLTYGETETMNVAFSPFVSGWRLSRDELLPYAEGKATPSYTPAYDTKVFSFNGMDKNVYIWTPEDYDASAAEAYDTIYMFDGQSVISTAIDSTFHQGCWNVCEHVSSMMNVTDHKAIVVGIETTGAPRNDELVPAIGALSEDGGRFFGEKGSGQTGTRFAEFITGTLIPYVEENYHVNSGRDHRALAGSSLGGLEAFYVAFEHPDAFGTIGALSPSLWAFDDDVWYNYLVSKVGKLDKIPFLYLYSGDTVEDSGFFVEGMYQSLIENGFPKDKIVMNVYRPGLHELAYWRNIYPEFLEAVYTKKVSGLENGAVLKLPEESTPSESSSPAAPDTRTEEFKQYLYFDNSKTKWEKVYAYWWSSSFGDCYNKITGELYGSAWPGLEMEPIEGTEIWRIAVPLKATKIIFSTGVTDEEVTAGMEAYQTVDLSYDEEANAGQVYKIDMTQKTKKGMGDEITKFKYPAGSWEDYTG